MNAITSVFQHPAFSVFITVAAFLVGNMLYERTGKRAWAQPFIVAFGALILLLLILPIPYSRYHTNTVVLQQLLGTTTVALALPIYFHAKKIRQYFLPLLCTLLTSSIFTVGMAVGILKLFDLDQSVWISMTTKSITTPIAVAISDQLGGSASLAASFVMVTGILGAMLGGGIMDRIGIKDQAARGIAYGLTSHALGTARALEINQECGAFSALAMGLNGIITALVLPFLLRLF